MIQVTQQSQMMQPSFRPFQLLHRRYRVEALLSHGPYVAVYRGFDTLLGMPVALKVSLETEDPFMAAELLRDEARCLAQLHHPGIPGYVDFFPIKKQWVLVMQYIEGIPLSTRRSFSILQLVRMGRSLCEILVYLHGQMAFVHQDIQPAHVLEQGHRLFLIDFSVHCHESGRSLGVSDSAFAAPEQLADGVITVKADMYGLGQTIRFLLTGQVAPLPSQAPILAVYRLSSTPGYNSLLSCCDAMTAPDPDARPDAWRAWQWFNELCSEVPSRLA